MSVPVVLELDESKLKREKPRDDRTRETEQRFDDDASAITVFSAPGREIPKPRVLACIVIAIFVAGFSAGQLVPNEDVRVVAFDEYHAPTASPWRRPSGEEIVGESPSWDILSVESGSDDAFISPLIEALEDPNFSLEVLISLLPDPDVSTTDTIALYSEGAYQALHAGLLPGKPFRMLINGGSSSAGGGFVDYYDSFFVRFGIELETRFGVVTEIVNRAHGDRNSMHSAMLGETFFVPNIDLIIWEFSINDQRDGATDIRNEFILWLHKILDIYDNDPPPVLLVYLWNKPFSTDKYGRIIADVYEEHRLLGAEYGFVLGHVNLASYLDAFRWTEDDLTRYFLADAIHPNILAHAAVAKLMVGFVNETLESIQHKFATETEFEWTCGDDMQEQWQIQEIFEGLLGGMPKAGFTAEVPRTTNTSFSCVLVPHKKFTNGTVDYDHRHFSTQRYGKANPGRIDRHRGVTIPFCNDGTLIFDLSHNTYITAIQFMLHEVEGVDGGDLGRRHLSGSDPTKEFLDGVRIAINSQDYTGQVVSAHDWNCLLSNELFSTWIVLEEKDRASPDHVSFCRDDTSPASNSHALEHLILF